MIISILLLGSVGLLWYIASARFYLRQAQMVEASLYLLILLALVGTSVLLPLTSRQRREKQWPHPPLFVVPAHLDRKMKTASEQDAIVLGYDIHGMPWLWPDRIRVMQAILLGMTGVGKTTLLKSLIVQDDLLSIEEVIKDELILFVSLNTNKNTEPVRALGKMLLQNLQLVVGKRYESKEERKRSCRPLLSVVLDEFAPFGYRNFPQIVQTARGTHTAFLFSMQSLPQLMSVGPRFKEDVSSTPNTTLCMRTRDETSAQYFIKASSQRSVPRRTLGVQRRKLLSWEHYSETGMGAVTEMKEARALDEHIKNLPKAQMEVLMSDDTRGTLHGLLHVVPPPAPGFSDYEPALSRRLLSACESSQGACLRFKDTTLARSVKLPRPRTL